KFRGHLVGYRLLRVAGVLTALLSYGLIGTPWAPAPVSSGAPADIPPLSWPQFRGPTGDGCATRADPPIVWSDSTNIAWKVGVPGRGRSSPIFLGQRLWLTTAIEHGLARTNIQGVDMQTADRVFL